MRIQIQIRENKTFLGIDFPLAHPFLLDFIAKNRDIFIKNNVYRKDARCRYLI